MLKVNTISERMLLPEMMKRCELHACHGACCTFGVWIDLKEKQRIQENSGIVKSCLDLDSGDFDNWFNLKQEEDPFTETGWVVHSKIVHRNDPFARKTCIFLRNDHKCALQVASQLLEKHHWYLKPFYCILHPMDLNPEGEITLDKPQTLLGEEKSCLRYDSEKQTPIEIFEEELRYLLGDDIFEGYLRKARIITRSKSNQKIE